MKQEDYRKQQAELLLSNPKFQTQIKELRILLGIPRNGFVNLVAFQKWQREFIHLKPNAMEPIDNSVTKIIYQYRLLPEWHHSIKRYLFLNKSDDMQLPEGIRIGIKRDEITKIPHVYLLISKDTTLEDIKTAWPQVKKYQKEVPYKTSKRQPAFQQKKSKRAFELQEQGLKYRKIAEQMENEGLGTYTYDYVKDMIKKYKKRGGIN